MNHESMHSWLTLGANVGVLVGILLLVVELSQSQQAMRAQTRNDLSTEIVELFSLVASNEQLASLRRRADAGEDLLPDEQYQYAMITRAFFRYWENVHYQHREGTYDAPEYLRQRAAWADYAARSRALSNWWCAHRTDFSGEFVAEFDALLTTYKCD